MKKSVFLMILLAASPVAEACTHGTFLLPMKEGMMPVAGAIPIAIRHQNATGEYTVQIYRAGTECPYENYTYTHTAYVIQRINDEPYYNGIVCGINGAGVGEATQNADGNGGPDDKLVRLKAITTSNDFDQMTDLIRPETYANSGYVIGYKSGALTAGYLIQGAMTIHTPGNPYRLKGEDSINGISLIRDKSNWSRGDPTLLEVRDLVYCWHRFNPKSDFAALYLPHLRLMWTTVDSASNGPMIPFSLDSFYVHPKIRSTEYAESLMSNPYSQVEIDQIEDRIMGIDGSYIGKYSIPEIQNRIVERMAIDANPAGYGAQIN